MLKVMSVDRPRILEAKLFEQQTRKNRALGQFLGAARNLLHLETDMWNLSQQLAGLFPHPRVELTSERPVQVCRDGSDVLRNRHLVVVQDDDEIFVGSSGMV